MSQLKRGIEWLFYNTYFQFDNKYYRQIFGIPMGSSVSSQFADIVMTDLEEKCLKNLSFKSLFFYRYVDDIFTCIPVNKIDEMLESFNSYHPRLQFTHEIESNSKLNFLDILIINKNGQIYTDWYQKPTFTGRFINYNSRHPQQQKIAIIYNLVDKAIKLSHKKFHNKNLQLIKDILVENDYPTYIIDKYIKFRIYKINNNNSNNNFKSNFDYIRTKKVCIPYTPRLFENFTNSLKKFNIILIQLLIKIFVT